MTNAPSRLADVSRTDCLVLLTSTFGLALSVVYLYIVGPLTRPVEAEFGWSRAEIFAGLSIVAVFSVAGAPLGGIAADRFGPRAVALVGTVIYSSCIALLSVASSFLAWCLIWLGVALGSVMIKPTVWFVAIARHFDARRGTAIGIALCGAGIGAGVIPFISSTIFSSLGWSEGLLVMGAGCAAIMAPLLLWAFPVKTVAAATATTFKSSGDSEERAPTGGFTELVKLSLCGFVVNFSVMALTVNFLPLVEWSAEGFAHGAAVAGVIGLTSIVARPLSGWLMDRYPAQLVAATAYSIPIIAIVLILAGGGSLLALILAAGFLGIALGSEVDSFAYLSSRYFSQSEYGTKFGIIMAFISLGVGLGPFCASLVFDLTGGYSALLLGVAPLLALCSVLVLSMKPYNL